MIIGREEEARRQDPKTGKPSRSASPNEFASPAGLAKFQGKGVNVKTMAVPESGVW